MAKVDQQTDRGVDACWLWVGHIEANGYGKLWFNGRQEWAHRVAWLLFVGPIPAGQVVRHLVCDTPLCVNVDHLALGTPQQNVDDAVGKNRHTIGARNGMTRLTADQVRAIRGEYEAGNVLMTTIADRYGVAESTIGMIVRRERWAHV